jgi:hypothetical protein
MTSRPDIEVEVRAVARELRFRSRPRMRTSGDAGSEREGLPERVEPGRTYRNARIRGWLRGRIKSSIATANRSILDAAGARRRGT